MISLRPLDGVNRADLEALRVTPQQGRFVSDVADSLAGAAAEPDGRAIAWGAYDRDTPVGFVMISDE
ncbi:MAG TPA: hypothetical protein VJ689_11080 [Gaiellaceae bacterium]|nr:hypothetical protein [Gaiellaceae bacterium]